MLTRSRAALIVALFAAAQCPSAWPQGTRPAPPSLSRVGNAASTVGRESRKAFVATGNFFTKLGARAGMESKNLFVRQGRFWKKFGQSFADFQEPAAVQAPVNAQQ